MNKGLKRLMKNVNEMGKLIETLSILNKSLLYAICSTFISTFPVISFPLSRLSDDK